jgi:hypothetical protein
MNTLKLQIFGRQNESLRSEVFAEARTGCFRTENRRHVPDCRLLSF